MSNTVFKYAFDRKSKGNKNCQYGITDWFCEDVSVMSTDVIADALATLNSQQAFDCLPDLDGALVRFRQYPSIA